MVMIRADKNEEDDFNVEIKISDEAISLTREMYDDNSIGEVELIETILSILMEMNNENHGDIIPLKRKEIFNLSGSNEYTFELVVSLVKNTFKGNVCVI